MLAVTVTAIGAVQVLRERAFVRPRDVGLDCFYDVERLAVLSPFRTVIERPAGDLGTLGTQILRAGLYQIKYGPCFRYTQR
jgi:LacI family transcriptional regulator